MSELKSLASKLPEKNMTYAIQYNHMRIQSPTNNSPKIPPKSHNSNEIKSLPSRNPCSRAFSSAARRAQTVAEEGEHRAPAAPCVILDRPLCIFLVPGRVFKLAQGRNCAAGEAVVRRESEWPPLAQRRAPRVFPLPPEECLIASARFFSATFFYYPRSSPVYVCGCMCMCTDDPGVFFGIAQLVRSGDTLVRSLLEVFWLRGDVGFSAGVVVVSDHGFLWGIS